MTTRMTHADSKPKDSEHTVVADLVSKRIQGAPYKDSTSSDAPDEAIRGALEGDSSSLSAPASTCVGQAQIETVPPKENLGLKVPASLSKCAAIRLSTPASLCVGQPQIETFKPNENLGLKMKRRNKNINRGAKRRKQEDAEREVVVRRKVFTSGKWGKWETHFSIPKREREGQLRQQKLWRHAFENNRGVLRVHTDVLCPPTQRDLTEELLHCNLYRQYTIQGGPEPRVQVMLHEDATEDFNT